MPYKDLEKQHKNELKKQLKYRSQPENRQKNKARELARIAFPDRKNCGKKYCNNIGERHHPDISKALEIIWLCHKHHMYEHRKSSGCTMQNCANPHVGLGLCQKHWNAQRYAKSKANL